MCQETDDLWKEKKGQRKDGRKGIMEGKKEGRKGSKWIDE